MQLQLLTATVCVHFYSDYDKLMPEPPNLSFYDSITKANTLWPSYRLMEKKSAKILGPGEESGKPYVVIRLKLR